MLVAAEDAVLSNSGLAVSLNLEWSRGLTQRVDLKTDKGKRSRFDAGAEELW